MSVNPAIKKHEAESHAAHDDLDAIFGEHLPPEITGRCWTLIDAMIGAAYHIDFEQERSLYGALIALLPDHVKQIRAAYAAILFNDHEDDWPQYEKGLPETIMPESKLSRLFHEHPDAFRDLYD
jgi:hypothetical protein